jgi:hypothetical protein
MNTTDLQTMSLREEAQEEDGLLECTTSMKHPRNIMRSTSRQAKELLVGVEEAVAELPGLENLEKQNEKFTQYTPVLLTSRGRNGSRQSDGRPRH